MTREVELRIMQLIELMRLENNRAEQEAQFGDGWLSDHGGQIREYSEEIDRLRTPRPSTGDKEVHESTGEKGINVQKSITDERSKEP